MRKWEGETHSTLSSVMEGQMFWKMEAEESRGTYPWTRSPWWELTFLTQAAAGKTDENLGCIFGRVRVSSEMGAEQRSRCKNVLQHVTPVTLYNLNQKFPLLILLPERLSQLYFLGSARKYKQSEGKNSFHQVLSVPPVFNLCKGSYS